MNAYSDKKIYMKFTVASCILLCFLLLSCQPKPHDHILRVSVTNWIGYMPLFYAKEKGYLESINVKLINAVSLSENMYLYKAGNSDAFGGTQYEHSILKQQFPSLVPIMLFDRSNGGDMIMSNQTISTLQNSDGQIDTYLEMDSINLIVLNDFIQKFNIDETRINYIDKDQSEISSLQYINPTQASLIVTYIPNDIKLRNSGFQELISTKNGLDLLVLGAVFARQEELMEHKQQFTKLKAIVDEAILSLEADPKEFYETIKPYFSELSYEDFDKQINDIVWVNKDLDPTLKMRLQEASFSIKDLL